MADQTTPASPVFAQVFGANATIHRTNDPNNMFTVVVPTGDGGNDPEQAQSVITYTFDAAKNQFIPSASGGNNWAAAAQNLPPPIDASTLGLPKDVTGALVPYAVAGLATQAGQNTDSWSNYAYTHNTLGGGDLSTQAKNLAGASNTIISYDNKPSQMGGVLGSIAAIGLAAFLGPEILAALGPEAAVSGEALVGLGGAGTGVSAGYLTAAEAAAGAGATGGSIVGSAGLLGTTGTASFDAALNAAGIGAAKNAAIQFATTGKVNASGVIGGAIGGGLTSMMPTEIAGSTILGAAAQGAVSGGVSAAASGGDVLKGALTGGATGAAGSAVKGALASNGISNPAVVGGFAGLVTGGLTAGINGGNIGTGALGGAISGTVTGGLTSTLGANAAGIIGGAIGSSATKTDTTNSTSPVTTTGTTGTTAATPSASSGFGGYIGNAPVSFQPLVQTNDWTKPRLNYAGA